MLINLSNVAIRRGGMDIVQGISFTIDEGKRIGISGRNGCGKSSLLSTLARFEQPDEGAIEYRSNLEMVALGQHALEQHRAAIDFVLDGHERFRNAQQNLEDAINEDNAVAISKAEEALSAVEGYRLESEASRILAGLGFKNESITSPVSSFSGGWQQRLLLARALIQPAELLLLDEPTNHLDIEAIDWLSRWLINQKASVLIVDHGRSFLEAVSTHTLLMQQGSARLYQGHVTHAQRQAAEALKQQKLEAARIDKKRIELEQFITRFRAKATKAAQARSRQKALDKLKEVAFNPMDPIYDWRWSGNNTHYGQLVRLESVSVGYGAETVLREISLSIESGERIGIVGINGSGKSTLIKALVGELEPQCGERWLSPRLEVNHFAQDGVESLPQSDTPLSWFLLKKPAWREQEVRNYLGGFGMGKDDLEREIRTLSGGERARLVLAHLAATDSNLLVLDEPTNHLDMTMRSSLSASLQSYEGAVVVVSHDRDVLSQIVDTLIVVESGTVRRFNDSLDVYLDRRHTTPKTSPKNELQNDDGKANRKLLRQQKAQEREAQAPIRKKMNDIEKKLEKIHELISTFDKELEDPALYQTDEGIARSNELSTQRKKLEYEGAELEAQWFELAEIFGEGV